MNSTFQVVSFTVLYVSLFFTKNPTNRLLILGSVALIITIYGLLWRNRNLSTTTKKHKAFSAKRSFVICLHILNRALRLILHQISSWAKGNLDKLQLLHKRKDDWEKYFKFIRSRVRYWSQYHIITWLINECKMQPFDKNETKTLGIQRTKNYNNFKF